MGNGNDRFSIVCAALFVNFFVLGVLYFFFCLLSMSLMDSDSWRHVGNGNDQFSIVRSAPILKVIVGL